MKQLKFLILLISFFCSFSAIAVSLKDYRPYKYEVLFTNPVCASYNYPRGVFSNSGNELKSKPKNVYCSKKDSATGLRNVSPQQRLVDWINLRRTKEIFMAYLSFSDKRVTDALCKAITERNVKLRLVLDSGRESAKANFLKNCIPLSGKEEDKIELILTGNSRGIGYAHDKLFIVNPGKKTVRIAFGSANMSSGTHLHHENWHFITTNSESYFAQAHYCLKEGLREHSKSKSAFQKYISNCRAAISTVEEGDIKSFFVPGEGQEAMRYITESIQSSSEIKLAVHRFFNKNLIAALDNKLRSSEPSDIKLVADDDLWWAGNRNIVGPNMSLEFYKLRNLVNLGLEARYMETNHGAHLLHHNKYIIFDNGLEGKPAVFTGAGNFTGAAFNKNLENFYFIQIPEVVEKFNKQYKKVWNRMATKVEDLPEKNTDPE